MNLFDVETSEKKDTKRIPGMGMGRPDDFQTPGNGLDVLLPHLSPFRRIWEPACGRGNIVRRLCSEGFDVHGSDILMGVDFLTSEVPPCDCIVTNPPFSLKNEFIARCYVIGKPFALLLPLTALETAARQQQWRKGLEIVFPKGRIHFETPSGKGTGAWFYTAWFTWGLNIGSPLNFAEETENAQEAMAF